MPSFLKMIRGEGEPRKQQGGRAKKNPEKKKRIIPRGLTRKRRKGKFYQELYGGGGGQKKKTKKGNIAPTNKGERLLTKEKTLPLLFNNPERRGNGWP